MNLLYNKIERTMDILSENKNRVVQRINNAVYRETGYKENNILPDTTNWDKLGFLEGKEKHFWINAQFSTPQAKDGYSYYLNVDTGVTGWDASNPQGILYLNGKMTQGLDTNHKEVFLDAGVDYDMYIYLYMSEVANPINVSMEVIEVHDNTEGLYYDMYVPFETLAVYNKNTSEFVNTLSVLEKTSNIIDFREAYSQAFYDSVEKARQFIKEEFYDKMCSTENKPVVHCIGHTHIDVEWLWDRKQTREKIQRSFANINALMEKYPEMKFSLSQPELYRYLKEEAPEKYEELKTLVKEGRWEPEGAMYVEADCNLISGESFVRQILYGKKFFKDEFGIDSTVLFLPDVFGYSAAIPQILKKSGIRHFVTSKISWNDTNQMPIDSFMWQGIDGTEIFTSFITAQPAKENHPQGSLTTYIGKINSQFAMGTWDRYRQKEYNKNVILTYGFGDGGGGPTKWMLEKYRRLEKGLPQIPVTKMNFLLPYLDESKKEFDENSQKLNRMPKWVGELYLEFHRGTYTSIAKNKRNNRKTELALQKTEGISYLDLLLGGTYDKKSFDAIWYKTLHNQFHDIIPGSSIKAVYDGTDIDYAEIKNILDNTFSDKVNKIKENVSSEGGLFVYNPNGFEYSGNVQTENGMAELTESISSLGWSVVSPSTDNAVKVSDGVAENNFYQIKIDNAGRIISLFDKEAQREVIISEKYLNEFQAFEDYPVNYDAWELSEYYKLKKYVLDEDAEISTITDGTRSGFNIKKRYMNSCISQNIWLYSKTKRIDFDTKIDWHQKHQVLKIAFPVDVHANEAKYEIQYGYVKRPTHSNTSWDQAKFEVCGHKWVDISENGFGFTLMNDCKYGFNAEENVIKLTALKCASYPNPEADEGLHEFSYAITTHNGNLAENKIVQQAYSFNQPLYSAHIGKQDGILPEKFSLASVDNDNVVIDTVKKAENSDDMIVRLYEAYDSRKNIKLSIPADFNEAYICDLMENELEKVPIANGEVLLSVKNFEIVTLKLKK